MLEIIFFTCNLIWYVFVCFYHMFKPYHTFFHVGVWGVGGGRKIWVPKMCNSELLKMKENAKLSFTTTFVQNHLKILTVEIHCIRYMVEFSTCFFANPSLSRFLPVHSKLQSHGNMNLQPYCCVKPL